MDDYFNIYVDRLRGGEVENLDRTFTPDFLEIGEKEIHFPDPIKVGGQAYIANDDLVLHLDISTVVMIPCSICNESIRIPVNAKGLYHFVPIKEIKGGVYKMQELLRESVLIEVPAFAECNDGNCPHRGELKKYMHQNTDKTGDAEEEGYQPFKDL
jgi:uncharacterized metal-binding protein YceD (DUF177 family)